MAWNLGLVSTVAVVGLVMSAPNGLVVEPSYRGPEPVLAQALGEGVDASGNTNSDGGNGSVDDETSRIHQRTVPLSLLSSHPSTTEVLPGAVVEVGGEHDSLLIHGKSGDRFAVRVGTKNEWLDWIEIANEDTEAPDETTSDDMALGPLWLGDEAMRFEVVDLGSANDHSSDAGHRELVITLLTDPEAGVAPRVAGKTQTAPGTRPEIHPRSDWTDKGRAGGVNGCSETPSYADNISALVVHHTVTDNNYPADKVDDLLRAILYAHVEINGWCDIGYNFVIDRFGRIWEARAGGVDRPVIGGHTKGYNTSTVGVAMLGQHHPGVKPTAVKPTGATEEAIVSLATWKLGLHGVDVNGMTWLRNRSSSGPQKRAANEWHYVPTILGHRDLGVTSCPGDHGFDVVHRLPQAMTELVDLEPPYGAEQWNSDDSGPGFVTVDQRGGLRAAGSVRLRGMGAAGPPELIAAEVGKPLAIAVTTPSEQTGPTDGDAPVGGYVLTDTGQVRAFGGVPAVADQPLAAEPLVDIAASAEGQGGWVVGRNGKVTGFGGQADRPVSQTTTVAVAAALDGDGSGYVLAADKTLLPVGTSPAAKLDQEGKGTADEVVDIALGPDSSSGWVLMSDGRIVPFGGAGEVALDRRAPAGTEYRAIVAAGNGTAGWLMATDGSLWPFGGAHLVKPLTTGAAHGDVVDVATSAVALPTVARTDPDGIYFDAVSQLFRGSSATDDELAQWSWTLAYGGGRKAVVAPLMSSTVKSELVARLVAEGSSDPGTFVDQLYVELLGRAAEEAGRNYWVRIVTHGEGRESVARQILLSEESRVYRLNKIYVDVLGRLPNHGEKSFWSNKLLAEDDGLLIGELASSAEFYNRVN